MRFSPFSALLISFVSWLGIGVMLLYKGLHLLLSTLQSQKSSWLIKKLGASMGSLENATLVFLCFALFVGFIKGRFVLSKTVNRLSDRFFSFGRPMSLKELYPTSYLILLSSMMTLGMVMKWVPMPSDLKGVMDVAVGFALINGSLQYFRLAFTKGKKATAK